MSGTSSINSYTWFHFRRAPLANNGMYHGGRVIILSLYDFYLRVFVFHIWTQVHHDHVDPGQATGKAGIKGMTARETQFDICFVQLDEWMGVFGPQLVCGGIAYRLSYPVPALALQSVEARVRQSSVQAYVISKNTNSSSQGQ
jgi:hypothetical protein